jgi:hypothetical protein
LQAGREDRGRGGGGALELAAAGAHDQAALSDADAPPVWRSAAVLRLPLARPPRRGLALLSTLLI